MGCLDREDKIIKAMRESDRIQPGRGVKAAYLCLVTGVTKSEMSRGLKELIAKGKIIKEGRHTHTTYRLGDLEKVKAKRLKEMNEGLKELIEKNKKKVAGRPKLASAHYKKKRDVRVSDENIALILERTGHSLQEFLDTKITALKGDQAVDESAMESLRNFRKSMKNHFPDKEKL